MLHYKLTLKFHANVEAFLEAAKGTSLPLSFVDMTRSLCYASVHFLILYGSFEETFTRFTSEQPVMIAADFVTTHGAKLLDDVLGVCLVTNCACSG